VLRLPAALIDDPGTDGTAPRIALEDVTEDVNSFRNDLSIGVEEKDGAGGTSRGSSVASSREARVTPHLDHVDGKIADRRERLLWAGIVNDDDVEAWLVTQRLDAGAQMLRTAVGDHHDVDIHR